MNKQKLIDKLRAKAKENGQKAARWLDYTDKNYFIGIQCGYDRSAKLVDQLDEPVHEKVTLPKAVGEELDNYKSHDKWFKDYIEDVFSGQDYMYAITYLANDNKLEALADAWRYGWEAEKEPKYLVWVKLPDTGAQFYKERLNGQPRWERRDRTDLLEASWYQFTKSEVEQLKSDYPYIEINEVTDEMW